MAVIFRLVPGALAVASLYLFAVTDSVTNNVLAAKKNNSPHIIFDSVNYNLERIKTDVKSDKEGWSESAKWQNTSSDDFIYVNIFAHVFYRKVIMRSHVRAPEQVVYEISGGDRVSVGSHGKGDFEKGFYEYVAYKPNGFQCVYIQSYWADRSFGGIDVVRGTKATDTIVGNHMLQVFLCDQRKKTIRSHDVTEILSSIELRDAHWSRSWFVPDTDTAQPGVSGSETSITNQAIVGPDPDTGFKRVSGTYRSEITSSVGYWFRLKKHRQLVITLDQKGNVVTGADNLTGSEITGKLEGDTIKFKYWSKYTTLNTEMSGEWKINDDGTYLEGFWAWKGDRKGIWNLTKIE